MVASYIIIECKQFILKVENLRLRLEKTFADERGITSVSSLCPSGIFSFISTFWLIRAGKSGKFRSNFLFTIHHLFSFCFKKWLPSPIILIQNSKHTHSISSLVLLRFFDLSEIVIFKKDLKSCWFELIAVYYYDSTVTLLRGIA